MSAPTPLGAMPYTLRYRASRADVWRWYWKAWRARLWRIHLAGGIAAAFILATSSPGGMTAGRFALCFLAAQPLITLLFAAVPQLRFKRAERVLQAGPGGWSTQIGRQSGSRTWSEVASIDEERGAVVINGTNGNALVIPASAFADAALRARFIADVRQWHGSAHGEGA